MSQLLREEKLADYLITLQRHLVIDKQRILPEGCILCESRVTQFGAHHADISQTYEESVCA